jgi:CHAD domain-containing protein
VRPLVSGLLNRRLQRFTRSIDGLERGDVTSLHSVRVASRRLRELVPVLQLESATSRKLNKRLRKITRRLGAVRELDVLLLLIDELQVSRPSHHQALRRVRAEVAAARDTARKRLKSHLPTDDLRWLARKLARAVERSRDGGAGGGSPDERSRVRAVRWAIEARVTRHADRVHEAMAAAGAVYLPERLHVVRIATKKLRYAYELWEQVHGERNTEHLRSFKRVQALLGRMHDLEVLINRVRETQASLPAPNVLAWREMNDLESTLEDMCRRLHARYVRERGVLEAQTRRPGGSAIVRTPNDRKAG